MTEVGSAQKPVLPWGVLKGMILDGFDEPLEVMKDYVGCGWGG